MGTFGLACQMQSVKSPECEVIGMGWMILWSIVAQTQLLGFTYASTAFEDKYLRRTGLGFCALDLISQKFEYVFSASGNMCPWDACSYCIDLNRFQMRIGMFKLVLLSQLISSEAQKLYCICCRSEGQVISRLLSAFFHESLR